MAVETSIVVEFGEDVPSAGDVVIIELDPTHENNLNTAGELKSTFAPGEMPVFIINHSDTISIDRVACTHGSIALIGNNISIEKSDSFVLTSDETTETINYVNVNSFTTETFLGNSGVIAVADSIVTTESGSYPCLCNVTYNAVFQFQYQLTPPTLSLDADETYEIVVVVYASII